MIASCTFDAAVLAPTFEEHPDLSVEVEGLDAGRSVPLRLVFWARNVDESALEATLRADQTVEDVNKLTSIEDATLYRSIHPENLPTTAVYNAALDHDALMLAATNEGDGWVVRMRVPDRSSLSSFVEQCQSLGVAVDVTSIRNRDDVTQNGFGLTPAQKEVIKLAWRQGYFSIPREVSLSDLADELNISRQAASERLRRGLWKLVSNSVCERITSPE